MADKTKETKTQELSIAYMLENVNAFYFTDSCVKCAFNTDETLCGRINCECTDYFHNGEKVSVCWIKTNKFTEGFLEALRSSSVKDVRAVSAQALLECVKSQNIQSL